MVFQKMLIQIKNWKTLLTHCYQNWKSLIGRNPKNGLYAILSMNFTVQNLEKRFLFSVQFTIVITISSILCFCITAAIQIVVCYYSLIGSLFLIKGESRGWMVYEMSSKIFHFQFEAPLPVGVDFIFNWKLFKGINLPPYTHVFSPKLFCCLFLNPLTAKIFAVFGH